MTLESKSMSKQMEKKSRKKRLEKKQRLKTAFELDQMRSTRECGECRECCTTMAVDELDKEAYVECNNLCSMGCKIYDTRPTSCKEFECM